MLLLVMRLSMSCAGRVFSPTGNNYRTDTAGRCPLLARLNRLKLGRKRLRLCGSPRGMACEVGEAGCTELR
jgi:hypothetical protein